MSIGETLARERRRAGLTVTQVSLQTRVRETVIRGMENDDFSVCGGNFYARGHIRNISRMIGIDPEPLVRDFDESHGGAPQPVSALEPEHPVAFRERRSPNWSAAMALAFALVVIYGVVQVFGGGGGPERRTARQVAGTPGPAGAANPVAPAPKKNDPVVEAPRKNVEVRLKAKRATWVNVRGDKGRTLFSGTIRRGDARKWKARKKLIILMGSGGGMKVTVNGKDIGSPGKGGRVLRLSFTPRDPETA
ncbi:helix-turn-helix domain-containing protein [Spirillospora sp. NBC_01491]|uniref:helix-turn-helix domain-containing protein n=1 Tax=Spirillospora sp. NBC_01491 TaxID=2976007 RepID=UPI00255A7198|nr:MULTISPECIES: helix-turn-helix domain-containing protein [Thermomonosporaceae]MDL4771463.1 helix-turn-helix domain-containing protein [Actinomadura xylanilytica]